MECFLVVRNLTPTFLSGKRIEMKTWLTCFRGVQEFNSNLAFWDVSKVVDMEGLFAGASTFNKPIGYWDTSNVTKMSHMFENAESFNQDVSKWDVDSVTHDNFENMFAELSRLTGSGHAKPRQGPPDTCELKEPYFFNALGNKMFSNKYDLNRCGLCMFNGRTNSRYLY